jgi:hypothetical protein
MSEFTFGLLYRRQDADALDPLLDDVDFVNDHDSLDDDWHVATLDLEAVSVLFEPQQDDWPEEVLQTKRVVVGALLSLSQTAPLLFFYNAEDHGWGYRLFHQGQECARFDLNYEADYQIAEAILHATHPGDDIHRVCSSEAWEAAHRQARESDAWLVQLREGSAQAHPERFAVFGLSPETIASMSDLLSEPSLKDALSGEDFHEPVERFKTLLGIKEMRWLM